MSLKLYIPTLDSPEKARVLKETILTSQPDAIIDTNINTNTVMIDAKASEETFKQLIEALGYKITPR